MSLEDDVTRGLAETIAAAGIATWRPDTTYQAGETALTIATLPEQPARAIALMVYDSDDDPHLADSTVMVQATIRGTEDPRDVDELAGSIFDLISGRAGYTLGGVPVTEGHRRSWARLGRDGNGRWRRSDNYYLQVNNPTTHRTF